MVVRGCFPLIPCFQRFHVLCVSCFFPFVSLIYGYGMLWLWIIVHHWGWTSQLWCRRGFHGFWPIPIFPWDQLPFDGEKAACQADADVILRAELMGWRASCFFAWVFHIRRFPKNGVPPNHSSPNILLKRMGFRDSPMFRTPPYEWDDEFIRHGLRYMNVYDRFHRGK